jgi:hypothetical protein
MSLKLRGKNQILPSFESLIDDDPIINDELLVSNIKKEVLDFSSHS